MKYRVNIDYEFALFDSNYEQNSSRYDHFNLEFEHLFFWIENKNKTLSSIREYSSDYLGYIENIRNEVPKYEKDNRKCQNNSANWWGDLTHLEIEKKVNSKITSTELALTYNWGHQFTSIIRDIDDWEKFLNKTTDDFFFVRDPYSFSGHSSITLQRKDDFFQILEKRFQRGPMLADSLLNRIRDFGTTFKENGDLFIIQNLIAKTGRFRGAIWNSKGFPEQDDILFYARKIKDVYRSYGWKGPIEIDSFYYLEDSALKYYPLVEVNCRKTMGLLLDSLSHLIVEDGVAIWAIFDDTEIEKSASFEKRLQELGRLSYNPVTKRGCLPISPENTRFSTYLIIEKNLKQLQHLINDLWKKLGDPNKSLPLEFVVYF